MSASQVRWGRRRPRSNPAQPTAFTSNSDWSAIGFSIDGPCHYAYQTVADSTTFTAGAAGDLDGDGVIAGFQRRGAIDNGGIQQTPLIITNGLG